MLPPGRPADPIPALRALLEVPLRVDLPAQVRGALTALESRAAAGGDQPWADVYRDALAAAEKVSATLDARLQELQRVRLQLGDPAAARQKHAATLRKEIERARAAVRTAISSVQADWQSRPKRQVDYVVEEAGKQLATLTIDERPLPGEVELAIDADWLRRYEGWLRSVIEAWIASSSAGIQRALAQELTPVYQSLARVFPDAPPLAPPHLGPVRAESPSFAPEPRRYDRPGFGGALAHYVRGNVMTVSMFGGVVAVLGALASGHSNASQYRNYLIAAALPLSLGAGVFAVRADRHKSRRKNLETRRTELTTLLKQETTKLAERQRDVIERLLVKRIGDAVPRELDTWLGEHAEPALARAEERGGADALELTVRLDKLSEEAGQLRTLNGMVTQQMMLDFKKRLRELTGTGTGP